MSLAQYLKSFSRLRIYKDRKKWSALTGFQALHKSFLLLSILDLIAQGSITKNFIEPSFELIETFNIYWNSIMPFGTKLDQYELVSYRGVLVENSIQVDALVMFMIGKGFFNKG